MTRHLRLFAFFFFLGFFSYPQAKEVPSHKALSSQTSQTHIELSYSLQSSKHSYTKLKSRTLFPKNINSIENLSPVSTLERRIPLQVAVNQSGETATEKKKQNDSTPKKNIEETADTAEIVKAPQPDETVENVIHYLRLVSDGSPKQEKRELKSFTALLLKDGRVFENEELAPSVFDPTKRPTGSAGTGRWQRDGEAYALAFSDGTEGTAVSVAAITSPAPPAMVLVGLFEETTPNPHPILPHRFNFFKDGSLILERPEQLPQSGHYKISLRSIEIDDGQGTRQSFIFGVHEPLENPELLVIGNKLYQRIEEDE